MGIRQWKQEYHAESLRTMHARGVSDSLAAHYAAHYAADRLARLHLTAMYRVHGSRRIMAHRRAAAYYLRLATTHYNEYARLADSGYC